MGLFVDVKTMCGEKGVGNVEKRYTIIRCVWVTLYPICFLLM